MDLASEKINLSDVQSKLLKLPILDETEELRIIKNRNQLNKSIKIRVSQNSCYPCTIERV